MRVFYISSRINAPDGSSVHGRAFVRNVKKLGHEIQTYPQIEPIQYLQEKTEKDTRSAWQKLRDAGLSRVIKSRIRRLGPLASDGVDFFDGMVETVRYFLDVRAELKTFTPDVLVYRATLFNFAPQLLRKFYGLPCVAEVNSIKYLEISVASRTGAAARVTKWAEQYAITHSDRVFVVSESIKDFVDSFYPPIHCTVVANGVETEDFDPSLFDREALKKELGLSGRRVLGYVGSYKSWHGLPISLELIKQLYAIDNKFMLLLIGNGEQYCEIKSEIEAEGLNAMVKQIDYVPHDKVPEVTSVFDYAVMTYPDFDGFYFSPLKMYEYMSMGTPVVSTNTGQIAKILKHAETGMLVHPPTPTNFIEAITALEESPELFTAIAKQSRQEVVAQHSWLENAKQVMTICEQIQRH